MPLTTNEADIDPQIPIEIGRIIMRWSRVEEAFASDIEHLSKHPNAEPFLMKEIPRAFSKRLAFWYRLARTNFHDIPLYLEKAKEIRDSADHLAEWRNNLVHGWITIQNGLVTIVTMKRSGKARRAMVYEGIQTNELIQVSQDIKNLEDEILSFGLNHFWLRTHLVRPSQS
jgi:hypothetical protein